MVPPPLPVAASGPLRVELRLANGQCDAKGCSDGKAFTISLEGFSNESCLFAIPKDRVLLDGILHAAVQSADHCCAQCM